MRKALALGMPVHDFWAVSPRAVHSLICADGGRQETIRPQARDAGGARRGGALDACP